MESNGAIGEKGASRARERGVDKSGIGVDEGFKDGTTRLHTKDVSECVKEGQQICI